jgi:HK97 gp10 family phage protein
MGIKVKINGITRLNKKLDQLVEHDLKKAVVDATGLVKTSATLLAPSTTGQLRQSIKMDVKQEDAAMVGKVFTNQEYAAYVEFGTGRKGKGTYPYEIEGVQLEYADYNWTFPDPKKEGERIWTSGQVAQPYMYPALALNKKNCTNIIQNSIKRKIRQIVKK